MSRSFLKFCGVSFFAAFAVAIAVLSVTNTAAQDLKAEDIIAKHLASIGTKEKRDEVKTRIASGMSTFQSKLPQNSTAGKAIVVSDPTNLMFMSSFKSQEYPYEKIGYFSEKISLPPVTAGTRSPLGAFIADHPKMIEDGLFGGSISQLWALHAPKGKVEAGGKKKIDGKEMYVLNYFPKSGGAEFTIKMFFDAATFQHVRTEYRHTISPREQKAGVLGTQSGTKIAVIEYFEDYKDEAGLMMPHVYKIHYSTDSNQGTFEYDWGINIAQYFFNQKLDPGFFTFEAK